MSMSVTVFLVSEILQRPWEGVGIDNTTVISNILDGSDVEI